MGSNFYNEVNVEEHYMQLSEVLRLFDSPLSQEQCWAICHGACRTLSTKRTEDFQRREKIRYVITFDSLMLTQRGEIEILHSEPHYGSPQKDSEIIFNLGNLICRCLDYGLNETEIEDVKFTDDLAELIGGMVLQSNEFDEGIGDSDSLSESWESKRFSTCRNFKALIEVTQFCEKRRLIRNISENKKHYLNVCKALYIEASELKAFLGHVMNDYTVDLYKSFEKSEELAKLYVQDWASLWVRVMNELRLNTSKYREIFPEDYQYVTYDVIPLDRKNRRRNFTNLPLDAEDMVYNFLRSRIVSVDITRSNSSRQSSLSDSQSSKSSKDDQVDNNTKKLKLSIDKNLLEKIEAWKIDDDLHDSSNNNIYPQQTQKKLIIYDKEYSNSLPKKDDFGLVKAKNESLRPRSMTFNSIFSKSLMNLDEVDLNKDDETFTDKKIGASLTEIFKIRQELTRSEFENSLDKNLINGKKCFACHKVKFSIFQRARTCAVCCKRYCLRCMELSYPIPSHLINSEPLNLNVAYGNQTSFFSHWDRHLSNLQMRYHSTDDLTRHRNKNRVVMNICVGCKELLENIESERAKNRWTVHLELNI